MKKLKTLWICTFCLIVLSSWSQDVDHCEDADKFYSLEDALEEAESCILLDIAMLKLSSISPDIAKLVNLECLDLSFNRFSTLPPEMAQLKKLRVLNLTGTRFLAKVPDVVYQLQALEELNLRDHPEWKGSQLEDTKKKLPNVLVLGDGD